MEKHTKTYLEFFPSHTGFYHCEICHCQATEIHHIKRRSEFGTKEKHLQDIIENLIALCRSCHSKAHANIYTKDYLKDVHNRNIEMYSK